MNIFEPSRTILIKLLNLILFERYEILSTFVYLKNTLIDFAMPVPPDSRG